MATLSAMTHTRLRREDISDKSLLRQVAGQIVVAAIAFAITAAIWELVITRLHARPEIPDPFRTKIDACLNSTANYDTLFVGSSRYFHGIDPVVFDAETGRLGVPTRSYDLGFDALNFPELRFVVDHVLADPRAHFKYLVIEPSLRVRLAPGLENSQRALTAHNEQGTWADFRFIIKGNQNWEHKLFWLFRHSCVSVVRLSNVGALTNRYIRPQEPQLNMAELTGPMSNGYSGLDPDILLGPRVTAPDIQEMVAAQMQAEKSGEARELNDFEINQLVEMEQQAAGHGTKLILLTPPTVAADTFEEFAAVTRASQSGQLHVPLLSFNDPVAFYDLYTPAGFTDPDHVGMPVSRLWSRHAADAFAAILQLHQQGTR